MKRRDGEKEKRRRAGENAKNKQVAYGGKTPYIYIGKIPE
jgi:hypothetical protein